MATSSFTATCPCGRVELRLSGEPIACVVCHCDDCLEFSRRFDDTLRVRDAAGGTPYALYRADRVELARGADLLDDRRLTATPTTRRAVASCCDTPMLLRFDRGPHWVSIFGARLTTPRAPQMRIQTKFVPEGTTVPSDVPAHRGFPLGLLARLVLAKLAMMVTRVLA